MYIVEHITNALAASISDRGSASFVVSGGSSPRKIYTELASGNYSNSVDWSRVIVTLVDDRQVPENHPDSNRKFILETLVQGDISKAQFIPLSVGGAVDNLARPFDIMLLGMGLDGHFASLFPSMINSPAMNLNAIPKIIKTGPHGDPFWPRISMNLSMIMQTRLIYLLVSGEVKQKVLERAKSDRLLPVHHLITQTLTPVEVISQ